MATKTKKPRTRPKKAKVKQEFLEGMEPPVIQAVEDAADQYYEVRTERKKLSEEEKMRKDTLIEQLQKAGIARYVTADGLIVEASAKSNVKVKRKKEENGAGEEGGEE